jgi:alkanesulfonate monooxygenase SsuD/methylene tetrahydromethanopterin reductase-like flavin-dependent oxidoreductase (luciferase family)
MALSFGTFNLTQRRDPARTGETIYAELVEQVRLAERLGFDTAWIAEHHFNNYSLCPSPLVMCAHLAAATRTIKLGTAVLVLPLYEPARVLQEIAMVDALSGGRLQVGIGSGYQQYEFDRFHASLDGAMEMTAEILDIIERGLTQDSFSHAGKHYAIPETRIAVKPVQKPMPPMWVAGMMANADIKRRVAAHGYIPFLAAALSPVEKLLPIRKAYDDAYREVGVDPRTQGMGLMRYFHLTDSKDEARDAAERCRYSTRISLSLRLNYAEMDGLVVKDVPFKDEPSIDAMMPNMIIGDAHTCAERILGDYDAMRATHIALYTQPGDLPHARVMRSLEKFASECVPIIAKELAKRGETLTFGPAAARKPAAE